MVTVIKYGTNKKNIRLLLEKLSKHRSSNGIDAYKYCGAITLVEEPLVIQKNIRNEWE